MIDQNLMQNQEDRQPAGRLAVDSDGADDRGKDLKDITMDDVGRPAFGADHYVFSPFLVQMRNDALVEGYDGIRLWLHLSETDAKSVFDCGIHNIKWGLDLVRIPDEVMVYTKFPGGERLSRALKKRHD